MSELCNCMKVSLKLIQGDVINRRRLAGREGGCSGPLEVTRIGGHRWGTLTATYAVFSLCYKFEVRGRLLLGPLLNCLVIDKLFSLSLWDIISISSNNNFTLFSLHLFLFTYF